ncbi:arginine synthesis PII-interacting regulator PirA [Myxosarcina sp. GI1(2024)]
MNIINQETLNQAALSHRESLRRSLSIRLEAAKARGDEKLVQQLQAEANYLNLN